MLFRALKNIGVQASMFSFSRQYPKLLYPGANDRDLSLGNYREPGVQYTIDSINPLTWWRTARNIEREQPDMVVFHWWTVFWAPCFAFMAYLLKRRGIRIAFICHNLVDHDASALKARISHHVLNLADTYLVHSSEHNSALQLTRPQISVAQHPIPIYDHYPQARVSLAKRGRLELLFFGFIRPYKGLDTLLHALELLNDNKVYLTVIGEYWGDTATLKERWAGCVGIEFHLHYMDDLEAAAYFERADFVVLPYQSATGSAVASLAFHYDKPVIATRVGGLPDVVIDGYTGLLVPPNDVDALSHTIASVDRETANLLRQGVNLFKKTNTWESLATQLTKLAV